jgi:glycerol-3-phosphate dehydrogenase (NAD(P)+)
VRIGVIGAGAWGTALAQTGAAGGEVLLWARDPALAATINRTHTNPTYLAGMPLSPQVRATADLADLAVCDTLLVVTPAQAVRSILAQVPAGRTLVLCSKGIEAESGLLMSEVAPQVRPEAAVAVLSGPSFAHEVAAGQPTALTLACEDSQVCSAICSRLALPAFRLYRSGDVVGAEIGGAVKNVLAIACGVVAGLGLGENARAALISRGFAEMSRFGIARGARPDTLAGLSGLGDLVLTCSSTQSRNFSLGVGLGRGASAAEMLADRRTVAEGAFTAPVLRREAAAAGVEMPIVEAVCALLEGKAEVSEVVGALLARPARSEGH